LKLFERICKGSCKVCGRFAVQTICLDEPGASSRVPEGPLEVPSGLGVVVGVPPTCSVSSCNRQSSESDVVHGYIRLGKHQIGSVACNGVRIGAWHMKDTGTTESGKTVGGSSCGGELSSTGSSTKMISNGCSYANRKVLLKRVRKNLLPATQPWGR
jgi:hypothetical protein